MSRKPSLRKPSVRKPSLRASLASGSIALAILLSGAHCLGAAQELEATQESKKTVAPASDAPAPAKKAVFRRRLPNFFSRVVDTKQREAIYKVQKEYFTKMAVLKAQLDAMAAQRDKKIAAVLSPEQLKEVEKLRADAQAKRMKKADEKRAKKSETSGK